jgi:hypothetical protein
MAETEVETILREIRERVLSEQRAGQDAERRSKRSSVTTGGNGGDSAFDGSQDTGTFAGESLALLNSYLTTTARAWDRLPPVVSNRSGLSAKIELWLKRHFKRATRWYAWEQVNFNAAVHHALRDLVPLLSTYEQELEKLRAQMARQSDLAETNNRLADLVRELRERDEHLRDEQRICYKQLALERSEGAVLEDRARRKTEALLEELARRVEEMDKR